MNGQPDRTDFSEIIAENFGANATYVEGLLDRFRSNPDLVDESWRAYFAEMLGTARPGGTNDNGGAARATTAAPQRPASASAQRCGRGARSTEKSAAAPANEPRAAQQPVPKASPAAQPSPVAGIRGRADSWRRAEDRRNMGLRASDGDLQSSGARQVLGENRLIINRNLKTESRQGFYTHISRSHFRALEKLPQMNDGFVNAGEPARLRRRK